MDELNVYTAKKSEAGGVDMHMSNIHMNLLYMNFCLTVYAGLHQQSVSRQEAKRNALRDEFMALYDLLKYLILSFAFC